MQNIIHADRRQLLTSRTDTVRVEVFVCLTELIR
jgi:hypothetical protein